jgi:hypothetical protein
MLAESLTQARELGYVELLANCVQAAGAVGLAGGADADAVARLQSAARHTLHEIGAGVQGLEEESFTVTEQALLERLGAERLSAVADAAREHELEEVVAEALALLETDRGRRS